MSAPNRSGDDVLLHETTSLCPRCHAAISAQVVRASDGRAVMHKRCEAHGDFSVMLSPSADWYWETATQQRLSSSSRLLGDESGTKGVEHGCPFDCGPCEDHQAKLRLPVVTITSACNIDCPICYVHNKNDAPFHMELSEFDRVLDHVLSAHNDATDIVNVTGGEPTMHPRWLELLQRAHERGVHRVTICTNGIALVKEPALVARLAEIGARVALSFDTFDDDVDLAMNGARLVELKLRCLELLNEHGVDTTVLPVVARGQNDGEIGRIVQHALALDCVRHVELHTMTFTGQSGVDFDRSARVTLLEVLDLLANQTEGLLERDDWVSSPCAHPLCYQIAYLLKGDDDDKPISLARLIGREAMRECLSDRLYLEPGPAMERALRLAIDRVWAQDDDDSARVLRALKRLLREVFPSDRAISRAEQTARMERAGKAIYVHSHMDAETWDNDRVAQCCDSNCYADGSTIPVCAYNVLYRDKEARFMRTPRAWGERRGVRPPSTSLPVIP